MQLDPGKKTTGFLLARSDRQAGGEHLILQFADTVWLQGLAEQRPDLTRLGPEQLGQHLGGIAVAGQRRFQIVDLFG